MWGFALAATLAGVPAMAQTIDGVRDASYPAALAVQTVGTGYGDSNSGTQAANGSELDNIHARIVGDDLFIFLGGNLQDNFNKLTLFFDTKTGGQNQLGSNGYFLSTFNGMRFDSGVTPDYVLSLGAGGGPYTAYINFLDIPSAGGGTNGAFNNDYLGSAANGQGNITFPDASVGEIGIDNSNILGVVGGNGAANNADAAAVSTGIEFRIPLSAIGSANNTGDIKIVAMIGNDNWSHISSQTLGGLPSGSNNLGAPSAINFTTRTGNQFVTVANGGLSTPPTIAVSPASLNFFNASATGGLVSRQLTVTNNGTATLNLTNVQSNNSAFAVTPTAATLTNGGSTQVTVTFDPSAGTQQNGILTFTSNDPNTPSKTVNVTGRGIPAGQVVLDGTRDASLYGPAKALQTTGTGFGDNQSELNGAFARVEGSNLFLMVTGNLEAGGNKLILFFDANPASGQTQFSGSNPSVDFGGSNNLAGLKFDRGFRPESFISINHNGSDLYANFAPMNGAGGSGTYLSTGGNGFTQPLDFGGGNTGELGFNNSNAGGISNTQINNPNQVTTGVEFRIPLAALGAGITATTPIHVMALITSGDYTYLSNQTLGGLPNGTGNLGLNGSGGGSLPITVDFLNFAGNQFFTAQRGDLTVPSSQFYDVAGEYNNVTIQNTGVASVFSPLNITGTLTVNGPNGELAFKSQGDAYINGPGDFVLNGNLHLSSPDGIVVSTSLGNVRVSGARTLNTTTSVYSYGNAAGGSLNTGNGLPLTISSIRVAPEVGAPATSVLLSRDLSILNRVDVSAANTTLNLNGNSLRLLSDGTNTASIFNDGGTGGTVIGSGGIQEVSLDAAYSGKGYRHYGSPVIAETIGGLSGLGFTPIINPTYNSTPFAQRSQPGVVVPFPNVFGYSETFVTTDFSEGYRSPSALTQTLTPGTGYSVLVNGLPKLLFNGAFQQTNVVMPLSNTANNSQSGWNLLANPFPWVMAWSGVTIPSGMNSQVSVFRPSASPTSNGGSYVTFVNGVGGTFDGDLPTSQGFFVRRTSAAGPAVNLTLPTSAAAADQTGNTHYRNANPSETRPMITLLLRGTGARSIFADEATVYFEAGATNASDVRYDGLKVGHSTGDVPTIATRLASGEEAQIDGRPVLTGSLAIPLVVEVPTTGSYQFDAARMLNFAPGQTITLEDAATGLSHDLTAAPVYTFQMNAAFRGPRFTLHFGQARVTGLASAAEAAFLSVFPNPSNGNLTIEWAGNQPLTGQVILTDALGRTVRSLTAAARMTLSDLTPGVYTLRANGPAGTLNRRVVVQ